MLQCNAPNVLFLQWRLKARNKTTLVCDDVRFIFHTGIYLTFKVTSDVPVTHVAANTDSTVPSPAVVTISCNQCFSVNKWFTSGKWKGSRKLIIPYCLASQKLNFSLSSFNWPDNDTHCATRLTRLVIEVISLPQAGSEKEYFTLPGSHGNLSLPPPLFPGVSLSFFGSSLVPNHSPEWGEALGECLPFLCYK